MQGSNYGRGAGVGRGLGIGASLGVGDGLAVAVGVGVGMGVKPGCSQYLPPVFQSSITAPPQTIISLPVQIAVCEDLAVGAFVVLVAVQLFVPGLYRPPALETVT